MGILCSGLNAYCMQTRPLFLRTSGSSGVPKALLLAWNGQISCNPKKKKKKKKQYPKPCTEWLCSPYPTCFALFAVGDDEGRLCRVSRTYLALRSGRRRNLTAVLTKICEDMPFSGVAATAPLFSFFFFLGGKAIHYICETHM